MREKTCSRSRALTLRTGSTHHELVERYQKLGYAITKVEPSPPDGPFSKPIQIVKMAKQL